MTIQNEAIWLDAVGARLRAGPADMPKASPGEIVVRTHALAINPLDYKLQDHGLWLQDFPSLLGLDLAGEVIEVGEGARLRKGDRVAGYKKVAAFQKYVAIDANDVGLLPPSITYEEGVIFPTAFQTALIGLSTMGVPPPTLSPAPSGKTIVVWGGSSSVGATAIQLAVAAGVKVIATASEKNFDLVRQAGASVINYKSGSVVQDIIEAVKDDFLGVFDAVSNSSSLEPVEKVLEALGGISLNLLEVPSSETVVRKNIHGLPNDFTAACYKDFFTEALHAGVYRPLPPPLVIGTGLESVQVGLDLSKKGVSARKIVVKLE